MIEIDVFYNDETRIVGFEAKGHAMGPDRAEQFDLVCCGVSTLTITTVNGITDFLMVDPQELIVDDGLLKMILPINKDGVISGSEPSLADRVETLLVSMVMGLEQMAEDYPQFVQLRKRRWTS